MNTRGHRWVWLVLFSVASLLPFCALQAADEDQPGSGINCSVAVMLRPQETPMWCWAASGQMVMETLGRNVPQCDQANNRFGHSDCCNHPTPVPCVEGGWPEFSKYGFSSSVTNSAPLTWSQIVDQICTKKKPFAFSWHWTDGGGHMMVLKACSQSGAQNYVTINNPWPPNVGEVQILTYAAYVSGPGYTHWDDYYDVTRVRRGEKIDEEKKQLVEVGGGDKASGPASSGNSEGMKEIKTALRESRNAATLGLKGFGNLETVKSLLPPGAGEK